jgi:hypothetical protein
MANFWPLDKFRRRAVIVLLGPLQSSTKKAESWMTLPLDFSWAGNLSAPFSAIGQETQPVLSYLDIRQLMITQKADAA